MLSPMTEVHKITSIDDVWQPGDIVLDANGNLRVRTTHPLYVWAYPDEGQTRFPYGHYPEGGIEDSQVPRPLTLLVRDGQAIGGRLITE